MAQGGARRSAKRKRQSHRDRTAARSAADGSELCLQCGLCCDGTLFSHIVLHDGEREYVESLGLEVEVEVDGGADGALEPCPAFQDGCCSLYATGRPQTCGTYRCGLLEKYTSGQLGLEDALVVVKLVWTLARQLEVEMGLPLGTYTRLNVRRYLEEKEPFQAPFEHAPFLIAFHRFNVLGERYFGYQPKPVEVQAAVAGEMVAIETAEGVPSG